MEDIHDFFTKRYYKKNKNNIVYIYILKIEDNIVYVGQTMHIKQRIWQHRKNYIKLGIDIEYEIVKEVDFDNRFIEEDKIIERYINDGCILFNKQYNKNRKII